MNNESAIRTFFLFKPFCHTRYEAIPMRAKRVVHTGPKIQLGGASSGLINVAYHPVIDGKVKKEPTLPTNSEIRIAKIILTTVGIFIRLFYHEVIHYMI